LTKEVYCGLKNDLSKSKSREEKYMRTFVEENSSKCKNILESIAQRERQDFIMI
jgi:hypothetical protein